MIEFRDISKGFWVKGAYRPVIHNLNLVLPSGQSLALLGRNGAGKSTLLNIVSGTMRPDTGEIFRSLRDLCGLTGDWLFGLSPDVVVVT
jgi:capsular polysaccharide transport system ATP-binding protein